MSRSISFYAGFLSPCMLISHVTSRQYFLLSVFLIRFICRANFFRAAFYMADSKTKFRGEG